MHSADPMSQRFGHPDSQIPSPSDGSVEQVTYPLAREYVGQGRLLMRDYKVFERIYIYNVIFHGIQERGAFYERSPEM